MANQLDRLQSQLLTSGIQKENNSLFQVISQLITATRKLVETPAVAAPSGAGIDKTYLTVNNESATLANSRQELAGNGVSFDDTVANARTVNVPLSQSVILTDGNETASLPNSRDLQAGVGVTFDDSVANVRTVSIASGSGFLTGSGNPQGIQAAGVGTWYIDTVTGYTYHKEGGGSTVYGWYIVTDPKLVYGPLPLLLITGSNPSSFIFSNSNGYGVFTDSAATFSQTVSGTATKTIINGKTFASGTTSGTAASITYISSVQSFKIFDDDFDIWVYINTDPTAITNTRIWFALTTSFPSDVITAPAYAGSSISWAVLRYLSDGNGVWEGTTTLTGSATRSVTASLGSIAAATSYKLRMRFVKAGTPTMYFSVNDGTELSLTGTIPASGTSAFLSLAVDQPAGAVAKAIRWRAFGGAIGS
jgi:hypothetical protein